jgi:hypothetical protein
LNAIAELESFLADYRYVYLGLFALNCYGLARHMAFDLLVLRDYGLEESWAAARIEAELISWEHETRRRIRGRGVGTRPLFEGDIGARVSSALLSQGCTRPVMTSSATQELEALVAASGGKLRTLTARTAVAGPLGNKTTLRRILPALGIEPIPHVLCSATALDFHTLKRRFGLPFVVQLPTGAGGSGTFFISDQQELRSLQERLGPQEIIASKYISGLAPNINAVTLDDDVLVSYPSVQLVGVPQCVPWESGYCGNDFAATRLLPSGAVQAIYEQTRRIGRWMGKQGYRGMWGIDFVVDGQRVYPVEVNARFQGSTRMLTELQYLDGQAPLVLAHVAGFLDGGQSLLNRIRTHWSEPQPLDGAQIDLKSLEQDVSVVRGSLRSGVYAWDGARGIYRREGMSIADCQHPHEFTISGTVPRWGTRVEPGAVLVRIQTPREICDGQSNRLQPWASELCTWVYRALSLS